ncbi:MAG: carboxy-S-adenosyl-L-methionine synthase CmoA [Desulfobulbus propionicus]|nr:MAG: carboxy-S-adenosyl-L-methionine synthase CmoA [Desulfobulbus propionicus]
MTKDKLFSNGKISEDFTFNDKVADVFDDMVNRSVPFYTTVIKGIGDLLNRHLCDGNTVVDLGCSTGSTLLELSRQLTAQNIRYIGVDNAAPMIEKARRKSELFSKDHLIEFREEDITQYDVDGANAVICNYTLQFIRPVARQSFLQGIYDGLAPGGLLLLSEKTISQEGQLNRNFIDIYHQFKKDQGYSELEIATKREALENVLVPFSPQENLEMLGRAGFSSMDIFFKWFNFSSFIAIK